MKIIGSESLDKDNPKMSKEDIERTKKQLQRRDRVIKVISKDGKFRVSIIKNTNAVKESQNRHKVDYLPTFLLARAMSAASLYASFLKNEERVIIDASGDGPISRVYAEALHVGEIRGFVNFAEDSEKLEINDLSDALGEGTFSLTRILENQAEPLTGIISITTGDIASEMILYFMQSEQTPSYVLLPVSFDEKTGLVIQSGGIIAQALPGYTDADIDSLIDIFENIPDILKLFEDGKNPKQVLEEILPFEFELLTSTMVDFYCRCSKELFKDKLLTLGSKEIKEMQAEDQRELVCQYCNEKYILTDEDFDDIITTAQAKEN